MKAYNNQTLVQLFQCISVSQSVELVRGNHFNWIKSENGAWPNKLFDFSISSQNLEAVLAEIEVGMANKVLPAVITCTEEEFELILTSSKSDKYKTGGWTTMTHDLTELVELSIYPNLSIKPVETTQQLEDWKRIVEDELIKGTIASDILPVIHAHENAYFYLGYINDQPVATALLFGDGKRGGIYLISTDSNYRKQGLGSLITNHCLKKAKKMGYHQIDIEATKSGKGVYAALGFLDAGKIGLFLVNQ